MAIGGRGVIDAWVWEVAGQRAIGERQPEERVATTANLVCVAAAVSMHLEGVEDV